MDVRFYVAMEINNCHRNVIQLVSSFCIRISLIWISKSMSLVLFAFKFQSCLQMNLLFIFKLADGFFAHSQLQLVGIGSALKCNSHYSFVFALFEVVCVCYVFYENPRGSAIRYIFHVDTDVVTFCVSQIVAAAKWKLLIWNLRLHLVGFSS